MVQHLRLRKTARKKYTVPFSRGTVQKLPFGKNLPDLPLGFSYPALPRALRQSLASDYAEMHGNHSLQNALVQRQPPEQERLSDVKFTPRESPKITGRNDPKSLTKNNLFTLVSLYTLSESYTVTPDGILYTQDWIRGVGEAAVQHAIRRALEVKRWAGEKDDIQQLANYIALVVPDGNRKDWLQHTFALRLKAVDEKAFRPETAEKFKKTYELEVRPLPGGGCMTAFYKGIGSLYSPAESEEVKKEVIGTARARGLAAAKRRKIADKEKIKELQQNQNSVDLILEVMQKRASAGPRTVLDYKRRQGKWEPDPETTVLGMVDPEFPGWYFFGLSVSGGYHSVILAVDTFSSSTPQIYWMDQFAKGFKKKVTGKLAKKMKEYEPGYGYTDSRVWPLIPAADAVVDVKAP